jgi:phosphoribosylamine--glycine ligase
LSYDKDQPINGLDGPKGEHQKIFHAGTKLSNADSGQVRVVTSGGRVLCATALGHTVSTAQATAYELVHQISWNNVYFRTDIAYRAVARENG